MAYKTFANGFPLPASDLNNFLMNQSVIVFADSAARTTAIPSPVTGMLTYLEDTNAYESWNGSAFVNINDNTDAIPKSTVTTAQDLIVADGASSVTRLGVGADDQVLSVVAGAVAWADAGGGGGGTTLISTTALSGSSTTISSIPATYRNLVFEFIGVDLSGNNSFEVALKAGANFLTVAGAQISSLDGSVQTGPESTLDAIRGGILGGNTNNYLDYTVTNYGATNNNQKRVTTTQTYNNVNGDNVAGYAVFGIYDTDTGAIDSVVASTSGTFDGGTFNLYGVS